MMFMVIAGGEVHGLNTTKIRSGLVQSLNSPFSPPHIGAEPGKVCPEMAGECNPGKEVPLRHIYRPDLGLVVVD